jgi:serine/threonine protein phosphatase PrpC
MKLSVFGKSMKGDDHQENEDSMLVDKKKNIFAIADGVTHPHGGRDAAIKSCRYLRDFFKGNMRDSFQKINEQIMKDREKKSVGYTTLTAAHVTDNLIKIANVGDSPLYIANGERIFRMTASDRMFGTASLSQAIGQEDISVHYSEEKFGTGLYVVILSDGITDVMNKDEIYEIIKKNKIPRNIVSAILKKASGRPTIYKDDKSMIVIQSKEK